MPPGPGPLRFLKAQKGIEGSRSYGRLAEVNTQAREGLMSPPSHLTAPERSASAKPGLWGRGTCRGSLTCLHFRNQKASAGGRPCLVLTTKPGLECLARSCRRLSNQLSRPVGRRSARGEKRVIQSHTPVAGHWPLNASLPPMLPHPASVLLQHTGQDACSLVEESQGSAGWLSHAGSPACREGPGVRSHCRFSAHLFPFTPEPGLTLTCPHSAASGFAGLALDFILSP